MSNPVVALLWVCWRMTVRWHGVLLLIVVAIAVAVTNSILSRLPRAAMVGMPMQEQVMMGRVFLAVPLFVLASFMSLSAISIGTKEGFPFRYQFGQPISTVTLVMIPMLYLCVICASLYFVPATLLRVLLGVPIPIAAPGTMVGLITAVLVSSSWSTTSTAMRGVGLLLSIPVVITLITSLGWFRAPGISEAEGAGTAALALTAIEYLILLLVFGLLLAFTIYAISRQRCGESSLLSGRRATPHSAVAGLNPLRNFSFKTLLDTLADKLTYPCPVNSAPGAELWFESKRYGMPIFIIGLGLTLAVPVMTLLSVVLNRPVFVQSVSYSPFFIFFGALGISIFNRRMGNRGYMNNFEGTRAMSTVQLASIQLLVVAGSALASIILICISIWISQTLANQVSGLGLDIVQLINWWTDASLLTRAAYLCTTMILYLSAVTLFASLHAGSVLWRKRFLIGALVVVLYAIYFTAKIAMASFNGQMLDPATFNSLKAHMWGFAICVLVLMLVAVAGNLYLKLFTLRSGSMVLLLWLGFLFCGYNILMGRDIQVTGMAPELLAFNCALLALPLTLFLLTVWSYDKLRHG